MKSVKFKRFLIIAAWIPAIAIVSYKFWLNGFTPYGEARGKAIEIEERIVDYVETHESWPKDLAFITDEELLYANGKRVEFDPEDLSVMFELDYLDPFSRLKKALGYGRSTGIGRSVIIANPELEQFRSSS